MNVGIPCPRCHLPLLPAANQCASCGSAAIVRKAEDDESPACRRHTDRLASATCTRCGAFACAICLVGSRTELVCSSCAPPARFAGVWWEDRNRALWSRLVSTWWNFSFAPSDSARRIGEGALWRPALFAVVCWLLYGVSLFCILTVTTPDDATVKPDGLLVGAALGVIWTLALGTSEYLCLRVMGLRPSLKAVLRVACYSSALVATPLFGYCLLFVAPFVRLVTLKTALELSWGEALIAVSAAPIAAISLVIAIRADTVWWP